jgi:transposase
MKAFAKASPVKTDRKDAHLIALAMKAGLYRAVHVKTDESQRLRFLLTARELLMRQVRQLEETMPTIDLPQRFRQSVTVAPHLGLTPRKYQSGETDRSGRISKYGDAMMRHLLYESATLVLGRLKRSTPLKEWGLNIAARRGTKRARVAVARKLAVILHRMWIDGTNFQWNAAPMQAA